MKRDVSFLFLIVLFCSTSSLSFASNVSQLDSIIKYRKISEDKKLSIGERIKAIDSAIYLAQNATDSTLLSQLAYKTRIYSNGKDYDSAITQTRLLLDKSKTLNNAYYQAIAYNKLGWYLNVKQEPIPAFTSYVKAIDLFAEVGDSLSVIKVSKRASFIQADQGDYDGAEYTIVNALKYGDAVKNISELAWLYDILGRVYRQRALWEEAVNYHKKALQFEDSPVSKASLLNNYGLTLILAGNFEEAIIQLEIALGYGEVISKNTRLRLLDNFAFAKGKLDDPTAISLLEQVLLSRGKINDIDGEYASNMHLSEIHKSRGNNEKSRFHAQEAYDLALKLNNPQAVIKALDLLIPVTRKSSTLFEEYVVLSDSLKNAQNKAKFEFAKLRYDVEKAEERESIAIQSQSASKLREETAVRKRNWALTALLGLGLLAFFWILYQKERSKKQRLQDQYNTEKRLAKKLHDELANEIYLVMSQLESDTTTPQVSEKLDHIYKMSRDLSRETQPIQTDSTFPKALSMSLQTYITAHRKLILKGLESVQWDLIAPTKKVEIYRVLQELMTNMRKHSKASFIALVFKHEDNILTINYSDNGVGTTLSPDKRNAGLNNIESRIDAINGQITFESKLNEGFRAALTVTT